MRTGLLRPKQGPEQPGPAAPQIQLAEHLLSPPAVAELAVSELSQARPVAGGLPACETFAPSLPRSVLGAPESPLLPAVHLPAGHWGASPSTELD